MRSIIALTLLAASAPAFAEEVIELEIGDEQNVGTGTQPICDNSAVATITRDGAGVLKATGAGETTCSIAPVSSPGVRRVFKVVVRPKGPKRGS